MFALVGEILPPVLADVVISTFGKTLNVTFNSPSAFRVSIVNM